jgi:hypothetical protein
LFCVRSIVQPTRSGIMNGRAQNFGTLHPPPHPHVATVPSRPEPPHYRGFTITLRYTTLGKTVLEEWSARHSDLDLKNTQHSPATDIGSERPQTHVLHHEATGISKFRNLQNGILWLDIRNLQYQLRGGQFWFTSDRCNSYLTCNSNGTVFKQGSQCTYNVTLRPIRVKNCCCGKAMSVCLQLYLSRLQSACAILYCHLWPVRLYCILHYLINRTIFGRKLLKITCLCCFSLQLLFDTFLSVRRTEPDIVINVQESSWQLPVFLVKVW